MAGVTDGSVRLKMLGGFELIWEDDLKSVPLGTQRLLALLALEKDGVHRGNAAETLWPDKPLRRAAGNLRTAIWSGRQLSGPAPLIACTGSRLQLLPDVHIDMHDALQHAEQLADQPDERLDQDSSSLVWALKQDLLPGWSDDWILDYRARWDELRVHTLEHLAQRLRAQEQYLPALQTALTAASIDTIRETPHRLVIEIHIAEGNVAKAIGCYQRYRRHLYRELGVAPSPLMSQLVRDLLAT